MAGTSAAVCARACVCVCAYMSAGLREIRRCVYGQMYMSVCVCAGECVWRMRVHERVYVRERTWGDVAIVVCVCVCGRERVVCAG